MAANIQKKQSILQDIEKEIFYTQEKIRQVANEIEKTKISEMNAHADKGDLDRVI